MFMNFPILSIYFPNIQIQTVLHFLLCLCDIWLLLKNGYFMSEN